ncbi:MAG TPA: hypothetical protein VMU01_09740 [Rhizomicrobium sp.]|nr:hypothetical protein [Rhizomicrobium sp.]
MSGYDRSVLAWVPRYLSLILIAMLWGLLVGEAARGELFGWPLLRAILAFAAFTALALLAWRREWVGGASFTVVALIYGCVPFLDRIVHDPKAVPFSMWGSVRVAVYFVLLGYIVATAVLFWWSWIARLRRVR